MSALPGEERTVRQVRCLEDRASTVVNGVRVDPTSPQGLLQAVGAFLGCGEAHVVHFLAADPTVRARKDLGYREVLNRGDLNVPDGAGVAWAMRMGGQSGRRLPGTEGMHLIARWGLERSLSHYLYGGSPRTLSATVRALERSHPGIRIVCAESPPFRPLSDRELVGAADRMRSSGADVVWMGLGTPKQDVVAERLRQLGAAPVIACVGAAFDFVGETKRRAPVWMQRAGLEWLHRLGSEPSRLWRRYLVGNPLFVAGVLRDRAATRSGRVAP
jgi:N-acetylglucosaminyldiphosphoundecaprenol N-acetyl-beta-D-mannosaminyltransferase